MSEEKKRVVWLKKKGLRRVLGVGDLFGVGFGDVGSSIYYALGATALFALGATPLALMIAGFVFICTAFSYAELASTFPEPGGSATYTRHAFNDLISFIAGWGLLLDYIVTMAISAFTIPPYFNQFLISFGLGFGDSTFAHLFTAILLLVGLYFINLIGMRQSGRMTFLLAVLTAISQLAVIVFGLFFVMHFPTVLSHIRIGAPFDWSPSLSDFLKGTAVAMVAYTGIEAIAQLAGETKKPQVTIPRAITLTVTILIIMYLGIISVGLSVITPKELGTTYLDNPIVGIVTHFPGSAFLVPAFGLVAALILLIASNAGLLGCSRLAFSLGEYYQVPSFFYKIHSKYRTPYVSLAFFTVLGCIILIASRGEMLFLVDLYNIGAQIAFFSTHIALIVLRIKKPELERPYRIPLNIPLGHKRSIPISAVIGAMANLAVFALIIVEKPDGRLAAAIWIAAGLVMYWLYRRKKKLNLLGSLLVEKVSVPEYKKISYKNILVTVRTSDDTESFQTACQLAHTHKAKLTAVYVLEIADTLPIDVHLPAREALGVAALKRAEAIAREYHLGVTLELVRARSIETIVSQLVEAEKFDLLVIGTSAKEFKSHQSFANEAKKMLSYSKCRVLFCRSGK